MNLNLENKVVIITGATGGIGRQICLDFLAEGAQIVSLYRNQEKWKDMQIWLKEKGAEISRCHGYIANILDSGELKKVIRTITDNHQSIDVLVNCAGSALEYPFALMDDKHIDQMIDINLKSAMLVSQAVLKPMIRQKKGSIINISSIAAEKGGRGIAVYAAAKAGLDAFTRGLAREIGKHGIRVNSVRPGVISTDMSKSLEDRAGAFLETNTILGRSGKPEEISKMVLFLASDTTSSFMTATTINIDGGLF